MNFIISLCFFFNYQKTKGEEVAETERSYDRAEEKAVRAVVDEIVNIRDLLKEENHIQETEDHALLDTMLYAQQRLQEALLRSFGEDVDLSTL